jgi:3-hydroxyacyl-CoA dehydrogenase
MKDIAQCDWIIEVVVERLDIKKIIYDQVEKYRKPGTLVSSNTSGHSHTPDGRGTEAKILKSIFAVPTSSTRHATCVCLKSSLPHIPTPPVVDFLMHYGDLYLGKTTVLCKDTPAFIANRVGVFSMMAVMHVMEKLGLTTDEIDALTGPAMGRPKSATFRTADVVGIDTLVKVAQGVKDNCPNDESRELFTIPAWLEKMVADNSLGDKTGGGFFKMDRSGGKKDLYTLNLKTGEYEPKQKPRFAPLEAAKPIDDPKATVESSDSRH